MPCRFASSGTVATSRSASRAILALNVASNFSRDLVISVLHPLRQSRTLHTLTFGPISGVHFTPDMEPLPNQTTVGSGVPQDTLTKADKLEIAYVRKVAPVDPVTQCARVTPEPSFPLPTMVPKFASRHWRDPNSIKVTKGSQDQRIKGSQPKKGQESKKSKNVEP